MFQVHSPTLGPGLHPRSMPPLEDHASIPGPCHHPRSMPPLQVIPPFQGHTSIPGPCPDSRTMSPSQVHASFSGPHLQSRTMPLSRSMPPFQGMALLQGHAEFHWVSFWATSTLGCILCEPKVWLHLKQEELTLQMKSLAFFLLELNLCSIWTFSRVRRFTHIREGRLFHSKSTDLNTYLIQRHLKETVQAPWPSHADTSIVPSQVDSVSQQVSWLLESRKGLCIPVITSRVYLKRQYSVDTGNGRFW